MRTFLIKVSVLTVLAGLGLFFAYQMATQQAQLVKKRDPVSSSKTEMKPVPEEQTSLQALRDENIRLREEKKALELKLEEKQKAWDMLTEELQKRTVPAGKPEPITLASGKGDDLPGSEFCSRLNRVLEADGVRDWKLFECDGASEGIVRNPMLHRIGLEGAVSGAVIAESMKLQLTETPGIVWLLLQKGFEIEQGQKRPFPDDILKIELGPVQIDRWKPVLPELFVSGPVSSGEVQNTSGLVGTGKKGPDQSLAVLERLNQLLEKKSSVYRFQSLTVVDAGELKDVQIEKRNSQSQLERSFQASAAKLQFDPNGKFVELLLERGTQLKQGQSSPLPHSGYRILLPNLSPIEWKAVFGRITKS